MLSLLEQCRLDNEDKLRRDLPEHAERIIAERRQERTWEIHKMVPVTPGLFSSNLRPLFVETITGNEYEVDDRLHELKWLLTKPYQNCNFIAVPLPN